MSGELSKPSRDDLAPPDRARTKSRVPRWVRTLLLAGIAVVVVFGVAAGILTYRVVTNFFHTRPAPESATGLRQVQPATFEHIAVVSAHPEASHVGLSVLQRGGSAADAAIAVQLVLGLVEPQSSGLGGGGFLLYYDALANHVRIYDGRETAPAAATPELFIGKDGDPLPFPLALLGGRSIGVPGIVRLLELVHADHGWLPWRELFSEAITLAQRGFIVTPRLARLVELDPILPTLTPAARYFFPNGEAIQAGERRDNLSYARVLQKLRDQGAHGFYEGDLAHDIARAAQTAVRPSVARGILNLILSEAGFDPGGNASIPAPGLLTAKDLADYRAVQREPLCRGYRKYRVCGVPPPSGGGVAILQALALLERFDVARLTPLSTDALHLLAEVGRLIDADREAWVGDPDHVSVPTRALLDAQYLRERSGLLRLDERVESPSPGRPPGTSQPALAQPAREVPSTTHFTIIDAQGNVACTTSSIEFGFGSHIMVNGFLLNNQLTDFSFAPAARGRSDVNAVGANKRPRSSMSPTIVFDAETGAFVAALGSPGGVRIVAYVLQTLVALLDWELPAQEAVSLPHVVARGSITELEDIGWPSAAFLQSRIADLEARGHEVRLTQQNSGLHVIQRSSQGLSTGVDPRREGVALGD